ncbi:MAG TPA: hypothetical protein PLU79_18190, partial [Burkholderiaceae bacterium]|nr:hypothetical protein [Burkholderiaceae bacterium]
MKRSKFAWIRTLLAAVLSIGWLVPAAIGVDRVLSFLNEDMARLSVMRSARPTYALPTEFNDAPNLLQAREYLIGAAAWLALVIAAWAIYIVRSRRALQTSLSVPAGDLLTAHRHALDHQFKEFAQEIDRHRRDLTSELGPLGQQVSGAQSLLQLRFDAVQDRLNGVDSAMAHQTETLRAVATRLEGGLSTASNQVQAQGEALRESMQKLGSELTEQIQAERTANDVQQRGDQDQRFVSIHNAVQVLAAQVETRLDAVQARQAEVAQAQAERLGSALAQQIDCSVDGLMLSVADAQALQRQDADALAQQVADKVAGQVTGPLIERVGPALGAQLANVLAEQTEPVRTALAALAAPVAQPAEPLRVEAQIPDALIERIDAALQARLAAQAERQAQGEDTLQALQTAVQALHDQLGETLQLQRDAGSEARRQAQAAVQARHAVMEAQAQAVADLAVRVDQLRELARSLHVERVAIDGTKWQEALAQIQAALAQAEAAAVAREAKRDSERTTAAPAADPAVAPAWAQELTQQLGSKLPQQLTEEVRAQLGELAQVHTQAQLQAQAESQRRVADLHDAVQTLQAQGEGLRAAVVDAVAGVDARLVERLDAAVSLAAAQAATQAASEAGTQAATGAVDAVAQRFTQSLAPQLDGLAGRVSAQVEALGQAQLRAADLHAAVQALQTQGEGLRAAVVGAVETAAAQAAAGVGEVRGAVEGAV